MIQNEKYRSVQMNGFKKRKYGSCNDAIKAPPVSV